MGKKRLKIDKKKKNELKMKLFEKNPKQIEQILMQIAKY